MGHLRTDPEYDAKIAVLYRCGLSMPQVAKRLGVSQGMVSHALRRTGTPIRSRREAMMLRHDPFMMTGLEG
jgi:predicted transcriptional regulator